MFWCGKISNLLLNDFHEEILDALIDKELIVKDQLDLSMVFDTVPHKTLLEVLYNEGTYRFALRLVETFLSGWTQLVKCGEVVSRSLTVIGDVSQGFGP